MTPPRWEQWGGADYPSEKHNPVIYFYPDNVDIEAVANRDDLALELHRDGVVPTKGAAHALLESALVIHGQVEYDAGELKFYDGPAFDFAHETHGATWVELDEYSD